MNNPKLKAVLVGCGGMSVEWLRAALEQRDLEIVGLVDLRLEAALERRDEFALEGAKVGASLEEMLRQTQPDLLFDCTIPEAHHANALLAFGYGVHVLGEKPLANSLEQGRELVSAAAAAGVLHAVTQNRRYEHGVRCIQEYLASGALGAISALYADFFVGAHFGGFRDEMAHVLLLDMAIHHFDAARAMSGQNPLRVYCEEWNPAGSWYAHGASATALFELTAGVRFHYRGSWCAEGTPTSWEAEWRIVGSEGTVVWDGISDPLVQQVSARGNFFSQIETRALPATPNPAKVGGHTAILAEFLGCVRTGRQPETRSSDNLFSLAMVFAAIESAERGERVEVRV